MVRFLPFFWGLLGSSTPILGFHSESSPSYSLASARCSSKSTTLVRYEAQRPFFEMPGRQNNCSCEVFMDTKHPIGVNQNYIPPRVPVRVVKPSRASEVSKLSPAVANPSLVGGIHFLEMGHGIQQAGASNHLDDKKIRTCMQDAGSAIEDIGVAWQEGDWEAVTYAALDASQNMVLVAQSLNRHKLYHTNELQQAYAGVAVELKQLSELRRPDALNLQGLSLRLYQASHSTLDDSTREQLELASLSAKRLAKLYGATSLFLPRRWLLWWYARTQHRQINDGDVNDDQDITSR